MGSQVVPVASVPSHAFRARDHQPLGSDGAVDQLIEHDQIEQAGDEQDTEHVDPQDEERHPFDRLPGSRA